jgi:hypothetical protein
MPASAKRRHKSRLDRPEESRRDPRIPDDPEPDVAGANYKRLRQNQSALTGERNAATRRCCKKSTLQKINTAPWEQAG